jgi:hypothetical protein
MTSQAYCTSSKAWPDSRGNHILTSEIVSLVCYVTSIGLGCYVAIVELTFCCLHAVQAAFRSRRNFLGLHAASEVSEFRIKHLL